MLQTEIFLPLDWLVRWFIDHPQVRIPRRTSLYHIPPLRRHDIRYDKINIDESLELVWSKIKATRQAVLVRDLISNRIAITLVLARHMRKMCLRNSHHCLSRLSVADQTLENVSRAFKKVGKNGVQQFIMVPTKSAVPLCRRRILSLSTMLPAVVVNDSLQITC